MTQSGAHGEYQILAEGNILLCRIHGSWNLHCANNFVADITERVKQFGGQPWARVINMTNYQLGTPEVTERMHRFGEWANENGCIQHNFIFSNDLQKDQVSTAYAAVLEFGIFENEAEAVAHCREMLARAANPT